jgi:hypothetical protein
VYNESEAFGYQLTIGVATVRLLLPEAEFPVLHAAQPAV